MHDATHMNASACVWCAYMMRTPYAWGIVCVVLTWRIHVCDVTHSSVWHDSFMSDMCAYGRLRVCSAKARMSEVFQMKESWPTWIRYGTYEWVMAHLNKYEGLWVCSAKTKMFEVCLRCVIWKYSSICAMTHSTVPWLVHMRQSFETYVPWLIHMRLWMCEMYVWGASYEWVKTNVNKQKLREP